MANKKSAPRKTRTKSALKVGTVGYGGQFNMGRQHLIEMKATGMVPTAVAEPDPKRRAVAENDFPGIATYPSLDALLKESEVDLLTLITPHDTHAKLALQCLNGGKHVVVEKPIAITTSDVDRMITAAKRKGVMLSTYHNRHWDGIILEAVDLVKKKKAIGDIVRIQCFMGGYQKPRDWWRSSRTHSGGILYDWGVHLLEYAFQLIDAPITEVCGFAHEGFWAPQSPWKDDAVEDEASAIVRFADGTWLNLRYSQLDTDPEEHRMVIIGTKGHLALGGADLRLLQIRGAKTVTTRQAARPGEGHRYYQNIRDHLIDGAPLVITPEWSRRPVHVIELAGKSARLGKALKPRYA